MVTFCEAKVIRRIFFILGNFFFLIKILNDVKSEERKIDLKIEEKKILMRLNAA